MAEAIKEIILHKSMDEVWKIVTDLKHYAWRSDIQRIEIIDDKTFVEYSKENIATHFYITTFEIGKRYAFDIENKNMKGHWIGLFEEIEGGVKFICEEHVEPKHMIMKPFIKKYLAKQQEQYSLDVKNALEK